MTTKELIATLRQIEKLADKEFLRLPMPERMAHTGTAKLLFEIARHAADEAEHELEEDGERS